MSKKPMNVESALGVLGAVDGGVMQDEVAVADAGAYLAEFAKDQDPEQIQAVWAEMTAPSEETAPVRLSPAEEYVQWVVAQEWAAAYSDSVTRLLEAIQKRARALL